jgi:hypothetical protein
MILEFLSLGCKMHQMGFENHAFLGNAAKQYISEKTRFLDQNQAFCCNHTIHWLHVMSA